MYQTYNYTVEHLENACCLRAYFNCCGVNRGRGLKISGSDSASTVPTCPVFVEPTCPAAGQKAAWLSYVYSHYIMRNFDPMSRDIWTRDP